MTTPRKFDSADASGPTPRRRIRRLSAALKTYKRLFAATTTILILLSLAMLGFAVNDEPDRVRLGTGKAGVMDSMAVADTLERDTAAAVATSPSPDDDVQRALPEGEASYYGNELAGRPTASGARFDPARLTAAHRTLPFGTRLRVTNVRNGQSVVVTVNDRGPYSGNRVLDLSRAAAQQIGMLQRGTARVRMDVLK